MAGKYRLNLVLLCDSENDAKNTTKLFNLRKGVMATNSKCEVRVEQISDFHFTISMIAGSSEYGKIIRFNADEI